MNKDLSIFVDRLRNGQVEEIALAIPPNTLDLDDEEISFPGEVKITGTAYTAGKELLLHLNLFADYTVLCTICGKPLTKKMQLNDLYHTVPLEEVKQAVYNYSHWIRETILLEAPRYAECNGKCPEREQLKKYLSDHEKDTHTNPFSSL